MNVCWLLNKQWGFCHIGRVSANARKITIATTDYIIAGSGVASIFTAIRLAKKGRVTVLSKQDLIAGNTWFAQGGIAAAFSPEDSPTLHFEDTLKADNYFGLRASGSGGSGEE